VKAIKLDAASLLTSGRELKTLVQGLARRGGGYPAKGATHFALPRQLAKFCILQAAVALVRFVGTGRGNLSHTFVIFVMLGVKRWREFL
jgi:hypothetical protein